MWTISTKSPVPAPSFLRRATALLTHLRVVIPILLLAGTALVLVPWWPYMPEAGLDPSWVQALNEAVGLGRQFGRELVFTYGPMASVLTAQFHPATDTRMLIGGLFIYGAYVSVFGALASPGRRWLAIPFAIATLVVAAWPTTRNLVLAVANLGCGINAAWAWRMSLAQLREPRPGAITRPRAAR